MVISLPKSSPGPFFGLFLSRNCRNPNLFTQVVSKWGYWGYHFWPSLIWPLPWIKLWYLPLLPLDSALLTKTQTPLRTVNAVNGCIWELPGTQLVGTIGTAPSCGMFQDLMWPMTKRLVTVESLADVCSPPKSVLHMRCTSHTNCRRSQSDQVFFDPDSSRRSQPKIKLVLSKITKH
jgi:hypothetical protein